MPEIDLRKYVMDQGNWVAVPTDVLRAMVEMLVEKSAGEVDEQTAVADMLFHASRNVFLSESDWAKRWRWTKSKAHRFLVKQRTKSEPRANQERTKSEPKSAENSLETPKSEPTANRQRTDSEPTANQPIYIDRAHHTHTTEEEKKEEEIYTARATELPAMVTPPAEESPPEGWTAETLPVLKAYRRWFGRAPTEAMRLIAHQLLTPLGFGRGATLPGDTKEYGGYTVEEVVRGIEDMSKSDHYSPASLIRHVAKINAKPTRKGTHGTHKQITSGPGQDAPIGGSSAGESLQGQVEAELRRRTGASGGVGSSGSDRKPSTAVPELTR